MKALVNATVGQPVNLPLNWMLIILSQDLSQGVKWLDKSPDRVIAQLIEHRIQLISCYPN
jgi:hypothetical protein